MKSLWDEGARRDLRMRLRSVAPDARPRWGRMRPPEVVAHLADTLRFALGEVAARPRRGSAARILRLTPVKQLFVYAVRFPRHAPGVPEMFGTRPGDWQEDVAALERLLERVAAHAARGDACWPEHPFFGRLTTRAWGVLGYKHTDHHLRQFGA